MGEKIRDLAKMKIGNTEVKIELNLAYHRNSKFDIHLQCDKGRICLNDKDFMRLATCFMVARKQLSQYKEISENE